MSRPPRNPAASIHRRLLNGARERGEDPQFILQRYAAERFLYRLGISPHREQFVLKGAMLFALWRGGSRSTARRSRDRSPRPSSAAARRSTPCFRPPSRPASTPTAPARSSGVPI